MAASITVMIVWDGTTITVENYHEPSEGDNYATVNSMVGLLNDAHHRARAALESIYKGNG